MVVDILFYGDKAGPDKRQINVSSKEEAFLELYRLNKTVKYGSRAHYLISNKLIQEEYEQWFKDPSNFNKIFSIK